MQKYVTMAKQGAWLARDYAGEWAGQVQQLGQRVLGRVWTAEKNPLALSESAKNSLKPVVDAWHSVFDMTEKEAEAAAIRREKSLIHAFQYSWSKVALLLEDRKLDLKAGDALAQGAWEHRFPSVPAELDSGAAPAAASGADAEVKQTVPCREWSVEGWTAQDTKKAVLRAAVVWAGAYCSWKMASWMNRAVNC